MSAHKPHKHPHQLTDLTTIRDYTLAGRATITLVSKKTGKRFTYLIRAARRLASTSTPAIPVWENVPGKWNVSVLTRPDQYTWLGRVEGVDNPVYRRAVTSRVTADAQSAKGWGWFWMKLCTHELAAVMDQLEVWHEGSCGRCGRALTVPSSIASGIGPECAQRMVVSGMLDLLLGA